MEIMLDSCIIIEAEKTNQIDLVKGHLICMSAITVSEIMAGVHRASNKVHQIRRLAFVDAVLARVSVRDFTKEAGLIHSELHAYLAKQGQLIGAHDLIIAATAIAYDCKLMTYNHREFERVPGLQLITTKDIK